VVIRLREGHRASLCFVALALAAGAFLLWATRDTTFMQDEWDFIQGRSVNSADAFLHPHNNHLLALLVLIYKALWSTVGLDDYWVWRLVAVGVHLTCVALLYDFARRRVGAIVAVSACLPILVLGSAWEDLLFPFNMQWYLSSAAFLAILRLTENEGPLVDAAIAALLLIALASSSLGPPVALGVAVACLMRRDWRGLALTAVPVVLYVLWFVTYSIGAENQPPTDLSASPSYLLHTAAGSLGALLGTPLGISQVADLGWPSTLIHLATIAAFAALAFQVTTGRRPLTPTLALILSVLLAYWLALTVTRGYEGQPYTSRYLYVSCLLLVLLGVEYFRGHRIVGPARAAVVAVAIVAAAFNVAILRHYSGERRFDAMMVTAELGALEISQNEVEPLFRPDEDVRRAPNIVAQSYFAATERIGSTPAPTPDELVRLPDDARGHADAVLIRALAVGLHPYTAAVRNLLGTVERDPDRAAVERVVGGTAAIRHDCLVVTPAPSKPTAVKVRVRRPRVLLSGAGADQLKVSIRRFASGSGWQQLAMGPAARQRLLIAPLGTSRRPWRLKLETAGVLRVC
jgi:hypothetical protein